MDRYSEGVLWQGVPAHGPSGPARWRCRQGARCLRIVCECIGEALDLPAPRLDACVLRRYFVTLPPGLLAFLRQCSAALAATRQTA